MALNSPKLFFHSFENCETWLYFSAEFQFIYLVVMYCIGILVSLFLLFLILTFWKPRKHTGKRFYKPV